jgi:predicted amidophosphoribosyltransferase
MRLAERLKRLERTANVLASPICPRCGRPHLWAAEDWVFCLCKECCRPLWEREAAAFMEELAQIAAGAT